MVLLDFQTENTGMAPQIEKIDTLFGYLLEEGSYVLFVVGEGEEIVDLEY